MSYDLSISIKPADHSQLKNFIQELPDMQPDLRMVKGTTHYMEIDLEFVNENEEYERGETKGQVNHISFHIPYDYLKKGDPDVYYNYVQQIADHTGSRAKDMQSGLFIDDPAFESFRVRGLTSNMEALYNSIQQKGNILYFSRTTTDYYPLAIDLNDLTLHQAEQKTKVSPEYPPFIKISHKVSGSGKWMAVAHWTDKKQLKIFSAKEVDTANQAVIDALWKKDPETVISGAGQVVMMAFSDDDKLLFSNAYKNKTLKLWDRATGNLIKNFSVYAGHIGAFKQINEKLLCVTSNAGISFFDIASGNLIIHVVPLKNNWITFTPNGDYEFKSKISDAIELDWIDNGKNESLCFIPGLGFAYYERNAAYKLNKVKAARGAEKENLLDIALKGFL
ncbi:hypothetical protein OGH69_12345 [Flavobacterium sp. MFBS3-15]|uniref:hypothetical protein n=1 Tax=Flavobacterium sp. MFBS3-15 TaxID=2989816 RepID=UPI00223698A5|nr:hypothetical protein [Flavobacterium sp. MFBS3-15]MCW4469761.1 hypothetical protein [Flavobacterium sp. MFBS3-15]